jgi:hypothetical protein
MKKPLLACVFSRFAIVEFRPSSQPRGPRLAPSWGGPKIKPCLLAPQRANSQVLHLQACFVPKPEVAWLPIRYWLPPFLCVAVSPLLRILA